MDGVNRFRSVSLTQQLSITSARAAKAEDLLEDPATHLGNLHQIRRHLEREIEARNDATAYVALQELMRFKARLKDVITMIDKIEKSKIAEEGKSPPSPLPAPEPPAAPLPPTRASVSPSRAILQPENLSLHLPRSRSDTLSTSGSHDNFPQSIDSVRFTNTPQLKPAESIALEISRPYSKSPLEFAPATKSAIRTTQSYSSMAGIQSGSVISPQASTPFPRQVIRRSRSSTSPSYKHFMVEHNAGLNLPDNSDETIRDSNTESPTWLLSDILRSISANKDRDEYYLVSRGNDLVTLLSQYTQLKNDLVMKTFFSEVSFMLYHPVLEVRATGYRICRYIISDHDSLTTLAQSKVLIFIILTMSRPNCDTEKEQAIKLVRSFLSVPQGVDSLSIGVVKSLLAIVENEDLDPNVEDELRLDNFKNVCIETILEIALVKAELIFLSGGFKTLLHVIQEGPIDLAASCMHCIVHILDAKDTRVFLRDGNDMTGLIAVFADNDLLISRDAKGLSSGKLAESRYSSSKLHRTAFLICTFVKNWNGLMAFSHLNFQSWKVLVATMKRPDNTLRETILDIFFDVLRMTPLPWLPGSSIGDMIETLNPNTTGSKDFVSKYLSVAAGSLEYSIISQYLGIILDILVHKCDIMTILAEIIQDNLQPGITAKANRLANSIYTMAFEHFPVELLDSKMLLPCGTIVTTSNEKLQQQGIARDAGPLLRDQATLATPAKIDNIKRYLDAILIESRYNMDETDLKNKIARTRVLVVKDYCDWNWMQLSELIQGPLRNPKKFEEILKSAPKFMKRLMSFYRPFKFRFCNTMISDSREKTKVSAKGHIFVTVGCQLFDALLSTKEGARYLSSNKIMPQLSETFAQIDPFSGIEAKEPVLSRKRLKQTLSYGYIDMIGVMSKYTLGIKILLQWQFVSIFHHILEASVVSMPSKDSSTSLQGSGLGYNYNNQQYLISLLLSKLDFTIDSSLRLVLSKALNICSVEIKVYIVESVLLAKLIKVPDCERWVIKLMAQRLYDQNDIIVDIAVKTLLTYSSVSEDNLNHIIALRPSINLLLKHNERDTKKNGQLLVMKLLSTSKGFKYLEEIGFVDREFKEWLSFKNADYAMRVEKLLEEILLPYNFRSGATKPGSSASDSGTVEEHFFSHILQTEEGLAYFQLYQNKQYLDDLITETEMIKLEIEAHYNTSEISLQLNDEEVIHTIQNMLLKLKENLWILGSIAKSPYGIQLLDPEYSRTLAVPIIPMIIDMVSNFPFWHVRGVALYQLGRVASTIEGTEILDELDWILVFNKYDQPCGLCFPNGTHRLQKLFNVNITNPYRDMKYYTIFGAGLSSDTADENELEEYNLLDVSITKSDNTQITKGDLRKYHRRVLTLINHLSAALGKIERRANKELLILKEAIPMLFASPILLLKVIKLIDKGKYKLRNRRFVFGLFYDTRVLETLMRRDKKK